MDVIDWLKVVLREARFVTGPDDALGALPDIGADGPIMTTMCLADGDWFGFPVAFHRSLSPALVPVLERGLKGREDVSTISADDALVRVLTELLLEANALSPRSLSLVMLELARQGGQGLAGQDKDLFKMDPVMARRLADAANALPQDPSLRGDALADVVWSLNARLALAWSHAAKLDPTVRPTRIYQALVASKLAWVLPAGNLSLPDDLPLVASVLGSKARPDLLKQAFNAVKATLEAAFKDPESGRGLIDLANGSTDSTVLATNPVVIAAAFAALPRLVNATTLIDAGLPKALAKGLVNGKGTGPLVATLKPIGKAIRSWDMLAAAAARCAPLLRSEEGWSTRHGGLKVGQPWALLAPAPGKPRTAWLVGVTSDELMLAAHAKADERGPVVFSALRAIWSRLAQEAEQLGGAASPANGPWYAAFEDEAGAQKFEQVVKSLLKTPVQLDLGALGGCLSLPHHAAVETRRIRGGVLGGWDGARLALGGAAVAQCLGTAAPPLGSLDANEADADGGNLLSELDSSHDDPLHDDPFADGESARPLSAESDEAIRDPFDDTPPIAPSSFPTSDPFAADGPPAAPTNGFGFDGPDPFAPPESEQPASPRIAPPMMLDDDLIVEDVPYEQTPDAPTAGQEVDASSSADHASPRHSPAEDPLISRPPLPDLTADPLMSEPPDLGTDYLIGETGPGRVQSLPPVSLGDNHRSKETLLPNGLFASGADPGPPVDPDEGPDPGFEDDGASPVPVDFEDFASDGMNVTVDIEDEEDEDSNVSQFFLPPPNADHAALKSADVADPFGLSPSAKGPPATENMTELEPPEEEPDFGFSVPPEPPQKAPPSSREERQSLEALGLSKADLGYLLDGYVTFEDGPEIVFGRRYGSTLVDVHRYPEASSSPYRAFILDKIQERFVPQNDRTASVPSSAAPKVLDVQAVAAALGPG